MADVQASCVQFGLPVLEFVETVELFWTKRLEAGAPVTWCGDVETQRCISNISDSSGTLDTLVLQEYHLNTCVTGKGTLVT